MQFLTETEEANKSAAKIGVRRSVTKLLSTILEKVGASGIAFTPPVADPAEVPAGATDVFDEE
eukprot:7095437-Lingulodinium_polyedra.AAC.1